MNRDTSGPIGHIWINRNQQEAKGQAAATEMYLSAIHFQRKDSLIVRCSDIDFYLTSLGGAEIASAFQVRSEAY